MLTQSVWFALGLTVFAGLSTGIGSLIALVNRKFNPKFLAVSLGFSAGVMIYVSLIEIFPKAKSALVAVQGQQLGYWITLISFFGGIAVIALIDHLIPNEHNPHEMANVNDGDPDAAEAMKSRTLMRMGVFAALAIGIHNFPEGLATFMAAMNDPTIGISIAVAIAIHNIPEGIAVSVPIYYATKSRRKAFTYSFLSGLSEPIGALLGFFILMNFMTDSVFGIVFAAVAGIMVYISLDELLPAAEKFGEHHLAIYGLIAGMAVMGISLVLFV